MPPVWECELALVKESHKKISIIQEFDAEFGELASREDSIAYVEDELESVDLSDFEDIEDISTLHRLKSNPERVFHILETSDLKYEPSDKIITGVKKYGTKIILLLEARVKLNYTNKYQYLRGKSKH